MGSEQGSEGDPILRNHGFCLGGVKKIWVRSKDRNMFPGPCHRRRQGTRALDMQMRTYTTSCSRMGCSDAPWSVLRFSLSGSVQPSEVCFQFSFSSVSVQFPYHFLFQLRLSFASVSCQDSFSVNVRFKFKVTSFPVSV